MCQQVHAAMESREVLVYEKQEQHEQSEKYQNVIELRNIEDHALSNHQLHVCTSIDCVAVSLDHHSESVK